MLAHSYHVIEQTKSSLLAACLFIDEHSTLLTGFLFQQIFIVVLFTSKDFAAVVFTVGDKAISQQTHNKTTEIKKAIHVMLALAFSVHSDSCVWILFWV